MPSMDFEFGGGDLDGFYKRKKARVYGEAQPDQGGEGSSVPAPNLPPEAPPIEVPGPSAPNPSVPTGPAGPYSPNPGGGDDVSKPSIKGPDPAAKGAFWPNTVRTDGYALPNPDYAPVSNFGNVPSGFEAANWNNPLMQTPKYVVGRLATQAASQAGGYNTPEFEKYFGESLKKVYGDQFQYLGKDRVRGPDGVEIDFISNYGAENAAPWWNPFDGSTGDAWSASTMPSGSGAWAWPETGGAEPFSGGQDFAAMMSSWLSHLQPPAQSNLPPPDYWQALLQQVSNPVVVNPGPTSQEWAALMAQLATPPPAPTYTPPNISIDLPSTPMPPPEYWTQLLDAVQTPPTLPAPQVNVAMPEPEPASMMAPITTVNTPLSMASSGVPAAVRMMAMKLPQMIAQRGSNDPLVQAIQALVGGA